MTENPKVKLSQPNDAGIRRITFWCPGCDEMHGINTTWAYNNDPIRPTLNPSILTKSGHYIRPEACWCKYDDKQIAAGQKPSGFKCSQCHSYIKEGRIEFLSDCSHALAGQTVDLPDHPNFQDD